MGLSRERVRNLLAQVQSMKARPPEVEALDIRLRGEEGGTQKNGPAFSP